jgi:chromate transporter
MKNLWKLYLTFVKIGAFMFGGGYSMLPLLTRELVDRLGWTSEDELLDYFAVAQCTPGVIAVNTATFIGQKRGGFWGGAFATLGVVTVPILLVIVIVSVLMRFWHLPAVVSAFHGIRIAVAALIAAAVVRLFRANVKNLFGIILCLLGFAAVAVFGQSPIIVVAAAAITGIVAGRIHK